MFRVTMSPAKPSPCRFLVFLLAIGFVHGDIYYPATCMGRCSEYDFISKLPYTTGPAASGDNRAYAWAIMTLIQMKLNADIISPPAAGRITAIMGSCLYEAAALHRRDYTSDVSDPFKLHEGATEMEMANVMDGAGFWALRRLFGDRESFNRVFTQYTNFADVGIRHLVPAMEAAAALPTTVLTDQILLMPYNRLAAVRAGAAICERVIEKYMADGFTPRGGLGGGPDPAAYDYINLPQQRAGITDCDIEILSYAHWQPLCIPHGPGGFGTATCTPQEFIYPWAGRYAPFALPDGDEHSGRDLVRPPPDVNSPEYREQWEDVLQISATLGDAEKIVAEYWADGPDTVMPAGHLWKIAADAARREPLSTAETARLLFIVGNAVYDAGIAAWRTKTSYDYLRPLQMIQCGDYRGQERVAWMCPYLGSGLVNISEWRPYQATTFVTPGFSAYVSGHSTFSAAGSEVLRLFFGDDHYRGPSCDRIPKGESLFEPESDVMPGFSDYPNTGPGTPGFAPAEDVILCWETFTEASDQSGISRLFGGIHIKADDTSGQELGRSIGRAVFEKANTLVHVSN